MTTSTRDSRTGTRPPKAGGYDHAPAYSKDLECILDADVRDSGISFDALGAAVGVDGETLRNMLDAADRRQLGASRIARVLRRLGTPEPFNRYMRIDGNQIGGVVHQLVPVHVRAAGVDLLTDAAANSRELSEIVERLAYALASDGRVDAVEASDSLKLVRPALERLCGVCAQLEAIARRTA